MEHYQAATVVNDLRPKNQKKKSTILVIMYTSGPDEIPFKLIKFTRANSTKSWESSAMLVKEFDRYTCVRSCFLLQGNIAFVATMFYMVFFDD